ncbi:MULTISPECIES: hypothetical protein [Sphingomonas]|uniref:DUF2306 domain-containing protein n=1 Tax=Sphingomonas bisphenolicum TaxID=296544 RepID=A0ABN5W922_9SPHN|nr:hypothetical protein [Sphingomonas bisphenolicum]MBA4091960.1 hypothetical protein [Sphingobium sp.]BBF68742.1 hypothetical protein SBA_ch1_09420 [Sphingomonas bisphenolicum]
MILGLSIPAFIVLHVAISLIGILAGLAALLAQAKGRFLPRIQALFLATTLLTSLTGFLFPFRGFTPAIGVGIVSTLVLIVALVVLYGLRLRGRARVVYAVSATAALWLNLFVLVVQSFLKMPWLHAFAPTGTEPPFLATQGLLLVAMLILGAAIVRQPSVARKAASRSIA